jgi:hypothetical protein
MISFAGSVGRRREVPRRLGLPADATSRGRPGPAQSLDWCRTGSVCRSSLGRWAARVRVLWNAEQSSSRFALSVELVPAI